MRVSRRINSIQKRLFLGLPTVVVRIIAALKASVAVCHHGDDPPALVAPIHLTDVLMESLPLFSTQGAKTLWKVVQVGVQEKHFDAHSSSQSPEVAEHGFNKFLTVFGFVIANKPLNYIPEAASC